MYYRKTKLQYRACTVNIAKILHCNCFAYLCSWLCIGEISADEKGRWGRWEARVRTPNLISYSKCLMNFASSNYSKRHCKLMQHCLIYLSVKYTYGTPNRHIIFKISGPAFVICELYIIYLFMLHTIDHTAVNIFYVIFLCKVVKSMYKNKQY